MDGCKHIINGSIQSGWIFIVGNLLEICVEVRVGLSKFFCESFL